MIEIIRFTVPVDLSNYTLVIPSVSVGNVPQLTVDLLISTHNLTKVGTLWHPAVIPSVGSDPYSEDTSNICTESEIYASSNLHLAVIQLRSGIELKFAVKFLNDLKAAISSYRLKDVVILGSTFAYELHNINSGHFRYISNQPVVSVMEKLSILPMEQDENGKYVLHGAGVTLRMFEVLNSALKCTVLIKYVSEGDNRPDAYSLLEILYKYVENLHNENMSNLKIPTSWKYVFGNPPPTGIY